MSFSYEQLAAKAGVDPWKLRDKLTAGNPAEITNLAKTFADASGEARLSTDLAKEASELTAQGYTVDNSPVHDPAKHVQDTKKLLGDGGEKMGKIARILDSISDELESRIGHAKSGVSTLEGEIRTIQSQWGEFWRKNHNMMDSNDREASLKTYVDQAVGRVREHGNALKTSVDSYETTLATHLKSMADLGYIPPDNVDEGPGDVNISVDAANADGQRTKDGLGKQPPSAEGVDAIQNGSSTIALLNAKVAAGHQLTEAERAYMNAWYDKVGADDLSKIPKYVNDAAPGRTREVVSPIADGIMNLSKPYTAPTGDTVVPTKDNMPKAVRELMDTPIGHRDEHTGLLWPDKELSSSKDMKVDGLNRWNGFADLMETSTVDGGTEFTKQLGTEAIRVKQDLNAISANATDALRYGMSSPEQYEKLKQQTADTGASDMLKVVGRNEDASAQLLLDKNSRQALMGLNWRDEGGAAAVIHGGTDRDPKDGGGGEAQAKAALEVIKEVGSDRDGYLHRMGEGVEDAVKDVGVQYMDAFARDPAGESRYRGDLTDPLGRKIGHGFELSGRDRDLFLQFMSGTGDDDATDFHTKATAYNQVMLTEAFKHGDPAQVNEALKQAGRLDGAITQANFDYTYDVTDAKDKEAAAAHRAESMRNTAIKTGISVAGTLVAAGVTIGTAGTGAVLIGPTVSVTNALVNGGANFAFMDDPAPAAELPGKRDELFRDDRSSYGSRRDLLITSAAINAGVIDPNDLPPGLTTRDADGNVVLRTPGDLDGSEEKKNLSTASHRAVNAYEAAHQTKTDSGDVDTPSYDTERNNTASGARDKDTPRNSPWSNADSARVLLYGDNVSKDGKVNRMFEDRVPSETGNYYSRNRK
ncbi:putative alpha/beta hydrolase [Kibdelosporangium aridum]|uniref:putative alpha/beta hydrolase n=1 Tax=Kibdelosporangium aridum TaxID=2030 RepID=UPI000527F8AA